jgi:hypothetical protein
MKLRIKSAKKAGSLTQEQLEQQRDKLNESLSRLQSFVAGLLDNSSQFSPFSIVGRYERYFIAKATVDPSELGIFGKFVESASLEAEVWPQTDESRTQTGMTLHLRYSHGKFARGGSNGVNTDNLRLGFDWVKNEFIRA